jgi:hypothetical protein
MREFLSSALDGDEQSVSIYLLFLWLYNPLLGLGGYFGFLIQYAVGRNPWTGDQPVSRPLPNTKAE